nr:coiled-coil domain-containing protein 81-like isoform X2 [Anser cygnoides]
MRPRMDFWDTGCAGPMVPPFTSMVRAAVWDTVAGYVQQQLLLRKGVHIPTLGSFDTIPEQVRVQAGDLTVQRPVFRLARNLSDAHQLTDDKAYVPGELSAYSLGSWQLREVHVPPLHGRGDQMSPIPLPGRRVADNPQTETACCGAGVTTGSLCAIAARASIPEKLPGGKQAPGTCSAAGSSHSSAPCPLQQGIPREPGGCWGVGVACVTAPSPALLCGFPGDKLLEPLRYTHIAAATFVSAKRVVGCIQATMSLFSRCIGKGKNVALILKDIGMLLIERPRVQMKYYRDFLEMMMGKDTLKEALLRVPGMLDLVIPRTATAASLTCSGHVIIFPEFELENVHDTPLRDYHNSPGKRLNEGRQKKAVLLRPPRQDEKERLLTGTNTSCPGYSGSRAWSLAPLEGNHLHQKRLQQATSTQPGAQPWVTAPGERDPA